jgi:DNA-binding LytR/AlgR family response regulator
MTQRYIKHFTINAFIDYWKTPIVQELNISERIRYCFLIFLVVAATTLFIDIISGLPFDPLILGIGTVIKAFGYTFGLMGAEIAISHFSKQKNPYSGLSVGKAWLISLVGYTGGFLMLHPYRSHLGHLEYHGSENSFLFYLKITPIWAIITYFFLQFHLNRSLCKELEQLQKLNTGLQKLNQQPYHQADPKTKKAGSESILIPNKETGKAVPIEISSITHINVIEHYSYLHFLQEGELKRVELKSPLKEIYERLPKEFFFQVHRAYLVNVQHIIKVKKIPRSYEITLNQLDTPIAISRYRLSEVLPRLELFLSEIW